MQIDERTKDDMWKRWIIDLSAFEEVPDVSPAFSKVIVWSWDEPVLGALWMNQHYYLTDDEQTIALLMTNEDGDDEQSTTSIGAADGIMREMIDEGS